MSTPPSETQTLDEPRVWSRHGEWHDLPDDRSRTAVPRGVWDQPLLDVIALLLETRIECYVGTPEKARARAEHAWHVLFDVIGDARW